MITTHFDSERDLMASFRKGDKEAVSMLFAEFYKLLVDYANLLINNTNEAEDIVVDTFVKLMKKNKDFKSLPDIKAFLYVTVRNDCYDYLRHEKVHDRFQKEAEYLSMQNAGAIANMDIALTEAELIYHIYKEVEKLPKQCREIFKMRFQQELSITAIALRLGITEVNVRNQHSKAIKLLKLAFLKKDFLPVLLQTVLFIIIETNKP